jgi:hypothetical protein
MSKFCLALLAPLAACAAGTNDVFVQLAPDVVSSLDGTVAVHATVLADRTPSPEESVEVSVDYTDRNGTPHTIAPVDGKTDKAGVFDATLSGLTWDGTGTVKVDVLAGTAPLKVDGKPVEADATFAVLDRTPPVVTIVPPANNQVRINTTTTVQVHVTDEIGVSQVFLEWDGNQGRQRSSFVATGATDTMVGFDFQVPDTATIGSTIMLYALAADMSGNEAAAQPVTVTVTQ